jgi:hypothetical protein
MALSLRSSVFALALITLSGCDPNAAFVGTWSGSTNLTSSSKTATKTGAVSIGAATKGVLVTLQMPLPTFDMPVLSTACELPATATSSDVLDFTAHDCPAVSISSNCFVTLKVATAKGTLLQPGSLKITGSGTVVGTGCTGGSFTDSFSFETLINR